MKHPVITHRGRLAVWWLSWFFITLGQLLLYYFAYGSLNNVFFFDGLISLVVFSSIALSLWYPFRFFNSGKNKPGAIILNLLLTGTISLAIWILITKYGLILINLKQNDFQKYWDSTFLYRTGTGIFIYLLIILAYYLFVSLTRLSEKKSKEAILESLVKETELRMLRSQINPHFLFNSLNSISSLTITDPVKARTMLIKLSDFMRYSLAGRNEQMVTFSSELENIRLYLDIEKVRFGEKLTTNEIIDENCLNINIPAMILQPLYENAVKHGVYESTDVVNIKTQASLSSGHIEIIISNNHDPEGSSSKGTGTGLSNVSRRLELIYGNAASLKITKETSIYIVRLILPVETLK